MADLDCQTGPSVQMLLVLEVVAFFGDILPMASKGQQMN